RHDRSSVLRGDVPSLRGGRGRVRCGVRLASPEHPPNPAYAHSAGAAPCLALIQTPVRAPFLRRIGLMTCDFTPVPWGCRREVLCSLEATLVSIPGGGLDWCKEVRSAAVLGPISRRRFVDPWRSGTSLAHGCTVVSPRAATRCPSPRSATGAPVPGVPRGRSPWLPSTRSRRCSTWNGERCRHWSDRPIGWDPWAHPSTRWRRPS